MHDLRLSGLTNHRDRLAFLIADKSRSFSIGGVGFFFIRTKMSENCVRSWLTSLINIIKWKMVWANKCSTPNEWHTVHLVDKCLRWLGWTMKSKCAFYQFFSVWYFLFFVRCLHLKLIYQKRWSPSYLLCAHSLTAVSWRVCFFFIKYYRFVKLVFVVWSGVMFLF